MFERYTDEALMTLACSRLAALKHGQRLIEPEHLLLGVGHDLDGVAMQLFSGAGIDVDELEVVRTLPLSDSSELPLRLRGAAALAGRIKASIAITGGVHTGLDVIKATMAGAHGTQMVSALLRHGPDHLRTVRREVETWMREHEWESLGEMRGNMSLERIPDPAAYERANFRMALR